MKSTASWRLLPLIGSSIVSMIDAVPVNFNSCPLPPVANVSTFVPFSNAATNPGLTADMALSFTIKTPYNGRPIPITASMDTGSMGVMIGAQLLGLPVTILNRYPKGSEFLDSSGVLWEGNWISAQDVNLTLTGGNVISKVPILAVTQASICSNYLGATLGCAAGAKTNVTYWPAIHYLGVGFGRWSTEQPLGLPDKSPLTNVAFINGTAVQPGSYHQGFILTSSGLHLGLTNTNTAGFAKMKLGLTASGVARDWAAPSVALAVDNTAYSYGNALFDTGIPWSYVRLNAQQTAQEHTTYSTVQNVTNRVLTGGSTVHMRIGNYPNYIAYYNVTAGDFSNPMRPYYGQFRPEPVTNATFINTGIKFYMGFDLYLDAECGNFGLRWKGTQGSSMGGVYLNGMTLP